MQPVTYCLQLSTAAVQPQAAVWFHDAAASQLPALVPAAQLSATLVQTDHLTFSSLNSVGYGFYDHEHLYLVSADAPIREVMTVS